MKVSINNRKGLSSVTLALAALLLAACGGDDDGGGEASGDPIRIGGAVDRTAYLADFDGPMIEGIELAVEAVNDGGGVLGGRSLEIDFQDMQADPQQGVRVVQRFATDGVAAVLHGFTSASTRAVQPILAQNEIPMVAASVLPEDEAFVFTTIAPARFETGVRVDYLVEQGITRIGVLHDGTPYNELQLNVLREAESSAGIEIVATEQHANDAVDLRPQVSSLLQSGADAVVKLSAGPTNIVTAKAMAQANTDVPLLIGIDSLSTHRQGAEAYEAYMTVASGPQVFDALPEGERSDSLTEFMNLYRESGSDEDPTYMGRGWDAVQLLTRAIEDAGSLDGPAVQSALEEMGPYEGASGTYDFSADSHYGFSQNPFHVVRFADEGSVEIVYSPQS